MGQIRVMTPVDGDKSIKWDSEDEKSVEKAKKKFEELKTKGYKMFEAVTETVTNKGNEVKDFDPSKSEYIAVPAMGGG
jgi:archaellum component FlaC